MNNIYYYGSPFQNTHQESVFSEPEPFQQRFWFEEPDELKASNATDNLSEGYRKMMISGIEGKACRTITSNRVSMSVRRVTKSIENSRTPAACTACKKIKKKCDELRPCSRCVRLKRASTCSTWNKEAESSDNQYAVEFPISFSPVALECDRFRPTPEFDVKHDFLREAVLKIRSFGLRLESLLYVFDSIPTALYPAMQKLFSSNSVAPMQIEDAPMLAHSLSITSDSEEAYVETDAQQWENDSTYGYFELLYNTESGQYKKVGMNARYAQIHGYHKEELLARYANNEAELQRTERDALFFFLFTFKHLTSGDSGSPTELYSRIFTGTGDNAQAALVWVMMGNVLNAQGKLVKLSVLIKVITAEEYDDAVRRTPQSCVLYAMGDRRSGQQLLDEIGLDVFRPVAQIGAADDDVEILERISEI